MKLLGFSDELNIYQEKIINEFYESNRINISLEQKKIIAEYYSHYFSLNDLTKDKQVFSKKFKSKITGLKYIIIKMPTDIALFECQ